MARPGPDTLPAPRGQLRGHAAEVLLAAVMLALLLLPAESHAAPAPADPAAQALLKAQAAFDSGNVSSALDILRALRSSWPASPVVPRALNLGVQYALAAKDDYRARYFYQRLVEDYPGTGAAFPAAVALARYYYDARAWDASLQFSKGAVDAWRPAGGSPRADLDVVLLRAAELSLYHGSDADGARGYMARINGASLQGPDVQLFRQLRVRLLWSVLDPPALGLKDANVSSLRVDGDDLWVGTWNGGVSRYAISAGHADPFPDPAYSRSIEVTDRRVWVGTAEGLAWYGKGTARWSVADPFEGTTPEKIQVVRAVQGVLYAGTLGDGLYRMDDTGWQAVTSGELPGRFITALAEDPARGRLLIGTINLGLISMDLRTGAMTVLSDVVPAFTSANITSILAASDGRVWIGTYGDGLASWTPETGALRLYTRATGEIGDDWVLAVCETSRGVYFGTFGGGVSFLSRGGTWRRIGISDGLSSLDVTSIAWRSPWLFFGTLGAGVSVYDEASDAPQP